MSSIISTVLLAALLAPIRSVYAGLDLTSSSNVAVYWGQNSYGASSGDLEQQNLAYYCASSDLDVIILSFVTVINGEGGAPEVNFANSGNDCTTFDGTATLDCPTIAADIVTCQSTYGKTVLLSIGGATYSEGGFTSTDAAVAGANLIWETFGPVQSGSTAVRPFGNSVVNGFDFDFESTVTNMATFGTQLRTLMDAAGTYYLTAAPQCPYPDSADNDMLDGAVYFDAIWIQFYNNYCGVQSYVAGSTTQNNFNFETWDNWASTVSKNPKVKILLGVPASATAAGSGYLSAADLAPVITYSKQFASFGGVMTWDASQAWSNSGWLDGVVSDLAASTKRFMNRNKIFG